MRAAAVYAMRCIASSAGIRYALTAQRNEYTIDGTQFARYDESRRDEWHYEHCQPRQISSIHATVTRRLFAAVIRYYFADAHAHAQLR